MLVVEKETYCESNSYDSSNFTLSNKKLDNRKVKINETKIFKKWYLIIRLGVIELNSLVAAILLPKRYSIKVING